MPQIKCWNSKPDKRSDENFFGLRQFRMLAGEVCDTKVEASPECALQHHQQEALEVSVTAIAAWGALRPETITVLDNWSEIE